MKKTTIDRKLQLLQSHQSWQDISSILSDKRTAGFGLCDIGCV